MRNDTTSTGHIELENLIPAADQEAAVGAFSSRMGNSSKRSRAVISGTGRWLVQKLHDLASTHRTGGLKSVIFGYTVSREDELRETAWLDGLRGVAAFLVMVYHYNLDAFAFTTEAPYGAKGTHPWELWRLPYLRILWCSGSTQVGIFFVLSGFVLSWSSLSSIREGRHEKFVLSLGSATFRRWMRLFVPCFLIGTLSLIQFYTGLIELPITKQKSFFAQVIDYLWECERFGNPFHLERNNWEVLHSYNPTMWTIPVEWAGSLIVFLVLLMVSRIRNYWRRTIILTVIPIYCYLSAKWNYWLFTTGILLADYVKQAGGFKQLSYGMSKRSRVFWILILLVGGWLGGIPMKHDKWYNRPGYEWTDNWIPKNWREIEGGTRYFWSWSGLMIIWGLSHFTTTRRFFERPFCRYLGKISFMLYLTHRMVGTIFGPPIRNMFLSLLGSPHPTKAKDGTSYLRIDGFLWNIVAYLGTWVFMLPVAFALANLSTVMVDEPSVTFAKWVDDRFVNGFANQREPERRTA